jgi:hypothetical protein
MTFSSFKSWTKLTLLVDINQDLEIYHPPHDKRIKLFRDPRSVVRDDYGHGQFWHVKPIAVTWDAISVFIVCPFCGEIHGHGNAPGHRVAHCTNPAPHNPGYVIDMPEPATANRA